MRIYVPTPIKSIQSSILNDDEEDDNNIHAVRTRGNNVITNTINIINIETPNELDYDLPIEREMKELERIKDDYKQMRKAQKRTSNNIVFYEELKEGDYLTNGIDIIINNNVKRCKSNIGTAKEFIEYDNLLKRCKYNRCNHIYYLHNKKNKVYVMCQKENEAYKYYLMVDDGKNKTKLYCYFYRFNMQYAISIKKKR